MNPSKVRIGRAPTIGEYSLTKKELEKMFSVVDNLEDLVLLEVAVTTGIRREDIGHGMIKRKRKSNWIKIESGIRIKDIDFSEKKLSFYESKKDRIHTVPLEESGLMNIRRLINSRGKQQSEFLITYSGRTAYTKLQEYCDKAGIRRRPFHALRATCIKLRQEAGWAEAKTAKLIGDTVNVVQTYYATPSFSELAEETRTKPILKMV